MDTMEDQNVTFRPIRFQRTNSLSDDSILTSPLFETTVMSLPNTPQKEKALILELKEKIMDLTTQLASAHTEIEVLNSEKCTLKSDLEKSTKLIHTYKQMSLSDSLYTSPKACRCNKRMRYSSTPLKTHATTQKSSTNQSSTSQSPRQGFATPVQPASRDLNLPGPSALPMSSCNVSKKPKEVTPINSMPKKHFSSNKSMKPRHRIIVIADDQGRHIQHTLQRLIGDRFLVTCFWKSGATLQDVLASERAEINLLTDKDYVIVLAGTNDRSPCILNICVSNFMCLTRNTNVLFCEILSNKYLREKKLNYEIKLLCSKFANVTYIDMGFSSKLPHSGTFARHSCQILLKEILRIDYRVKYRDFHSITRTNRPILVDKATQTTHVKLSEGRDHNDGKRMDLCNIPPTTPDTNNTFFRQ